MRIKRDDVCKTLSVKLGAENCLINALPILQGVYFSQILSTHNFIGCSNLADKVNRAGFITCTCQVRKPRVEGSAAPVVRS